MRIHRKTPTPNHRIEWFSPPQLFEELNREFHFTLDPCSPVDEQYRLPVNNHFTVVDNGLILPWYGRVYVNPPWGWHLTSRWVEKAHLESRRDEVEVVVGFLPAQVDADWFHDHVLGRTEIRFLRGRPKMFNRDGDAYRCRIGTMVVVWGEIQLDSF